MKSVLFLMLCCFTASLTTTDRAEEKEQKDNTEYRHEDALLMWRFNTLTYCSQETLSVYSKTTYITLRQ